MTNIISELKKKGIAWTEKALHGSITQTKQGSITYLLYGAKPSQQSINIKLGRLGEFLSKELIMNNPNLELLTCGIQTINEKNKDVDLLFKDETYKIIYYRELKGNIELDTEKLPATINKCKEIETSLKTKYAGYAINCGILNWSVYNRSLLNAGLSNIHSFEKSGIKIDHMEDFLKLVNITWPAEDFYGYFRELGDLINAKFELEK